MAVLMSFVFILLLSKSAASLTCFNFICARSQVAFTQIGNSKCDPFCLSPQCDFDSSDCLPICLQTCEASLLGDGVCDGSKYYIACAKRECAWDQGDCGFCAMGCTHQVGWEHLLGNGVCDEACDTEECEYDGGDCRTTVQVGGIISGDNRHFASVSQAISELGSSDVIIYVFPGSFSMTQTSGEISLSIKRSLELKAVCENCTDPFVMIQLSSDSVGIQVYGQMTIQNVGFQGGFSLLESCEEPKCRYCPNAFFNTTSGKWLDDRNEVMQSFAPQSACDFYKDSVLFDVHSGAQLTLINVSFTNIKHQLLSLIRSDCGKIQLQNVTFSEVTIRRNSIESGIIMHSSSSGLQCGEVAYIGGRVELTNNGFEFRPGPAFSGFAVLSKAALISIRSVVFQSNMLLVNSLDDTALFTARDFTSLQITECSFASNLVNLAVLHLEISKVDGSSVVNVTSSRFEDNFGMEIAAIRLVVQHIPLQIIIANCTFSGNSALEESILTLLSINSGRSGKLRPNGDFLYENSTAINNFAPYFFSVRNFESLQVRGLRFKGNGDSPDEISAVFHKFLSNPHIYMTIIPDFLAKSCAGTLLIDNVGYVEVMNTNFTACFCLLGSPGLTLTGLSTSIAISNLRFTDNQGEELIALEATSDLILSNLHFENNTHETTTKAVCLRFTPTFPVNITVLDTVFVSNHGFQYTLASISGVKAFTLVRITAVNNTALLSNAGFWFKPLTKDHSSLQVSDSRFEGNSAFTKGVISLIDYEGAGLYQGARTRLLISNTVFIENFATVAGSCVTIAGFVHLDPTSFIKNSVFERNVCSNNGAALFSLSAYERDSSPYARLSVSDSTFLANFGDSTISITASSFELYTVRCQFAKSRGIAVRLLSSVWFESQSTFTSNAGANAGSVFLSDRSRLLAIDTSFLSNTALLHGGGVTVWLGSIFTCSNCLFEGNQSEDHGGAIDLEETSQFFGDKVAFRGNSAVTKGAAIMCINSIAHCEGCFLEKNSVSGMGVVFLMEAAAEFRNSVLRFNHANSGPAGFMLLESTVIIANCTFSDHTGDYGTFISAACQSIIAITASHFYRGHAAQIGGCFYAAVNSTMSMTDSEVVDCSAEVFGNVVMIRTGVLIMSRVDIHDVSSQQTVGSIVVSEGSADLELRCWNLGGGAILALFASIRIRRSRFDEMAAYYGGALSCSECAEVIVTDSVFVGGLAKKGGAVYTISSGSAGRRFVTEYRNCTFIHNRAVNGGAIFSESAHVYLTECVFVNNSASANYYDSVEILNRGIGGALFFVNANLAIGVYQVHNNTFINNTASNMGAVLYWFDTYPTLEGNSFYNNVAPYGNEIASFPIRLAILSESNSLLEYLTTDPVPLVMRLTNVASGHASPCIIRIALIDQYNHIVTLDSLSTAQLQGDNSQTAGCSGDIQVDAIKGVFTFNNVTFFGQPKSVQNFTILTPSINPYLKKYTSDPSTYHDRVRLEVEFRDCIPGESYQGITCYPCTQGTFSLDPTQPCKSCPSEAICYGGFSMVPKSGYWRPDPFLDLFFECENAAACTGSQNNGNYSLTGECAEGYFGNLCHVCDVGYSRSGKSNCLRCPSLNSNIAISCFITSIGLFLFALAVFLALRGAKRPRSKIAIFVKIFVNYVQMAVVAASLNLKWPGFVDQFLNGQQIIGSVADQLFSLECILQAINTKNVYYSIVTMIILLPAGLISLSIMFWISVALCKPIVSVFDKIIASAIVILFVLHPSLTKVLFSSFSCLELRPTEFWLTSDLSQRCWDRSHAQQLLTMTVPGLIVWCFGLPIVCLLFLVKSRKKLSISTISLRFSFLYKGYRHRLFYWEFVVLYRKVALVCSSVFFSTVSTLTQALCVLAVLLVYLFLQFKVRPFSLPVYNLLEMKSIFVSLVTIYVGLHFEAYSISKVHTGFGLSIFLFVIILIANAYFLASWLCYVVPIIIETIKQSYYNFSTHLGSNGEREDQPSSATFAQVRST